MYVTSTYVSSIYLYSNNVKPLDIIVPSIGENW